MSAPSIGPGEQSTRRDGRRVDRNPALLCLHHALMMTLFPMAVLTIFQHDRLGLDMAEIMLVQAAFGAALALFEFPSGLLADRIGYRPTMIAASLVSTAAWGLYCVAEGFWSVVVAEVALGLGLSLVSGTSSAMLYESLDEAGRAEDFALWFGRTRFFSQLAEGTAALGAGLLFALSPRLPFALMVVVWGVNVVVAVALVEPRYERRPAGPALERVRDLVATVARHAPRLRALFALGVVLGLASFVPVWIVTLYARDAGVAVSWLGPIWSLANYTVALGSLASARLGARVGVHVVLAGCIGLVALGYLGMGLTHAWWGFVFYFALNLCRGLSAPLLAHAEQTEIASGDRASLVSLRSLLFRAGFVLLGPMVGAAIDRHGAHAVLIGLGVGFVALALAARAHLARLGD